MNLDKCKFFYEKYGMQMIHEKFPDYEGRIAVGMVGEGSDCFGFEDDYSKDHDYGIGFSLWISDSDYDEIGQKLQAEYKNLIIKNKKEIMELSGCFNENNIFLSGRRGVCRIKNFYEKILGIKITDQDNFLRTDQEWLMISEEKFATSVNGEIFRDDLGLFTFFREKIKSYYPEKVWLLKLANQIHIFSQNGQYNYSRMMARGDYLTADICAAQAEKGAMAVVYLLNKAYAPYYKWMRKGMDNLTNLKEISYVIDSIAEMNNQKYAWNEGLNYSSLKVNRLDKKAAAFEKIAEIILKELCNQNLVTGKNTFLDVYCKEIFNRGEI